MRGIVDEIESRVTGSDPPGGKATYQNLFAFAPAVICVIGAPYESAMDRTLREKAPDIKDEAKADWEQAMSDLEAKRKVARAKAVDQ